MSPTEPDDNQITQATTITNPSPIYETPSKQELIEWRKGQMRHVIHEEVQELMKNATLYQQKQAEAKTITKREFYSKKIRKIRNQIIPMLATLKNLDLAKS